MNLFRIAQEAMENALKHSGATELSISLDREGRSVRLAVQDNGKGIQTKNEEKVWVSISCAIARWDSVEHSISKDFLKVVLESPPLCRFHKGRSAIKQAIACYGARSWRTRERDHFSEMSANVSKLRIDKRLREMKPAI